MSDEHEFADGPMTDNRKAERRQNNVASLTRDDLKSLIYDAIKEVHTPVLTEDEIRWVRLAIQSEAKRAEWRAAVVNHSTLVLVGLFIVWLATHSFDILAGVVDYFRTPKPPVVK